MLLIAAMKLLAGPPAEEGPRCNAYYAIKNSLLEAESSCILELRVLQAIILMALFELGHAIYPAAYLTIGYCVRYGSALGIHEAVEHYSEETFSASESEERRRSWWAIIILDRLVYNLSCYLFISVLFFVSHLIYFVVTHETITANSLTINQFRQPGKCR